MDVNAIATRFATAEREVSEREQKTKKVFFSMKTNG